MEMRGQTWFSANLPLEREQLLFYLRAGLKIVWKTNILLPHGI